MNNSIVIDIKINEIPNICRICLSKQATINILNTQYENVPMKNIFQITLHHPINKNDKGPTSLCKQCLELLIQFYQFSIKYERNKPILKQLSALAQATANGTNFHQVSQANPDIEEINIKQEPIDIWEGSVENNVDPLNEDIEEDQDCFDSKEKVVSSTEAYDCRLCEFNAELESSLNPSNGIANHYLQKHFININDSKFRCEKCRLSFSSIDHIQEHYRSEEHQSTECPICKTIFETIAEQYRHVKACEPKTLDVKPIKNDEKPREIKEPFNETYFCHLCQINIETFEEVIRHYKEKVHRLANTCMLCNTPQKQIHTHIFTHRPERMRFGCIPCHIGFENMQDLAKHKQETNHVMLQCHLCEKMIHRGIYYEHLKKHSKSDPIICDICGKLYTDKRSLRTHYNVVHKEKRFYCDKCFTSFSTLSTLKIHTAKKHNDTDSMVNNRKTSSKKRKFFCDKCPAAYTSMNTLKDHTAKKHDEMKSPLTRNADDCKYYSCEYCGKRIYKYHRKTAILHEAQHKFGHKFICPVADCMLTFPDKESRQQHKSNDHQNFVCEECEKLCYDINSFRAHSFLHTWNKNCSDPNIPKCWICNEKFATFEILVAHLKVSYGLLMCSRDNCHRIFTRNLNLNKHTSDIHNNRANRNGNNRKSLMRNC